MGYIIKLIYITAVDRELHEKPIFEMMTDSRFEDYVDDLQLVDAMHFIRKYGNRAVHSGGTTPEASLQSQKYLHFSTGKLCIGLGMIILIRNRLKSEIK